MGTASSTGTCIPPNRPPYPGPVPADHAPPSLFDHLPSRPSYEDLERGFALMRDRISARLDLGLPRPRRWACGVHRRGWAIWADGQQQPPSA